MLLTTFINYCLYACLRAADHSYNEGWRKPTAGCRVPLPCPSLPAMGTGPKRNCLQRKAGKAFLPEVLAARHHKASLMLRSHIRCWIKHK